MTPRKVTAVICALNEEKCLPQVLPKIPTCVEEVILVDGHSKDRTVEVAKALRPDIKVLCQPGSGKGAALKYGTAFSKGDIIVTLDADGTYPPEEIPKFVHAIIQGYDFAKGTRFLSEDANCMPGNRRLGNRFWHMQLTSCSALGIRTYALVIMLSPRMFLIELT